MKGLDEASPESPRAGERARRRLDLPDPIARTALRGSLAACLLVLLAATVGAAIRLLPWALDPSIPGATLAPFAKSLLAVAAEAAVLTGWPVGWALAAQRLVDRGEARVLALLGESPARTLLRLAPQAAFFAVLLAMTSLLLGRQAAAPGRVVDALLASGKAACAAASHPITHSVPFVSSTWLCRPGASEDATDARADASPPRLVGRAPLGGVIFTAAEAHVSDDLRRIELGDARLVLGHPAASPDEGGDGAPASANIRIHVRELTLHGLAPWARVSSVPPVLRAVVATLSAALGACAAVQALLRRRGRRIGGVGAVALGAAGPLAALAALHGLELRLPDLPDGARNGLGLGWLAALALVPVVAVASVAIAAALLSSLPERRRAGTK